VNRFHRIAGPVLLVAAVGWFIAFHFFPAFGWRRGVRIWSEIAGSMMDPASALTSGMAPIFAVFATFAAGIFAAPLAIPLIRKSLLVRWFIAFLSALVFLGLLLCLPTVSGFHLGIGGMICLLLAAACNVYGILLIPYEGRHRETLRKLSGN
jgi:hypothetical protein